MLLEFWDNCYNYYKEIETDEIEVDNKTIEQIKNESYNQALEDYITEIERQTTFYCGKDSHLRQILEQLKRI